MISATCDSRSGDHKGAAFPFEEITAHQVTRQFPGSTKAIKGAPIIAENSPHYRHLISYAAARWHHKEMMHATKVSFELFIVCNKVLQHVQRGRGRSSTGPFSSCVFPERGLKGKHLGALQAAVAVP